jgi:hypothetical protein
MTGSLFAHSKCFVLLEKFTVQEGNFEIQNNQGVKITFCSCLYRFYWQHGMEVDLLTLAISCHFSEKKRFSR